MKATPAPRKAAAPSPKSKTTAPPTKTTTLSAEDEQLAFDRVRTSAPAPSAVQIRALLRLTPSARCIELGATTRADKVLPEARRAFLSAAATITAHGVRLRYSAMRLRFLADQIHALELQLARQTASNSGVRARSSAAVRAETDAKSARKSLAALLDEIVPADPVLTERFETARGNLKETTTLQSSLNALLALADDVLAHEDEEVRALAELHHLDAEALAPWKLAAQKLAHATDEQHTSNTPGTRDLPATNELEGRVMLELKALYNSIAAHRTSTEDALPAFGEVLQRALWPKSAAKKAPAAPVAAGAAKVAAT